MVRVGGGWTTLSHFLARHGGDPNHEILPDELLPLDTKPASVNPRNRSSSTHTLVIPANALHSPASSGNHREYHHNHHNHHYSNGSNSSNSQTPTPTPDITAHVHRGSVTPTTPYHPQSRFINSTPASRRSSISSPEPSIGSSTSGYSSR